ncbi:hypothetical protein [Saccharospirillum mangrovi]|uniref:hypothetical protein n=1 Tax=Saccharospirillum mangrovi TaxID=2161747 RepID=UPI000D380D3B|nr:hypothetical protein [Saccharospirillum mangrovi]
MRYSSTDGLRWLGVLLLAALYVWVAWRILVATPAPLYQGWLDSEAERVRIERIAAQIPPRWPD